MRSLTGSLSLVFLGSDTLLTLIRGPFARPIAELKSFFPEPVDIFVALEESRFVHVKRIASIVGPIVSLSPSCGTVSQIMTRYLHFIVNSRHSWNSSLFVHDQGKNELLFSRHDLKALNGVLFWPVPCVLSVVVSSDASANGCTAFIHGTDLVFQRNWSLDESEKSFTWKELAAIKFSIEALVLACPNKGFEFVGILIVRMRFR